MSKYRVRLDYYATTNVMVEASSEKEAREIALSQDLKFEDFDLELETVFITNQKEEGGK